MLKAGNHDKPLIVFQDIKFDILTAIIEYCYTGNVTLRKDQISIFTQHAISLGIKGMLEPGEAQREGPQKDPTGLIRTISNNDFETLPTKSPLSCGLLLSTVPVASHKKSMDGPLVVIQAQNEELTELPEFIVQGETFDLTLDEDDSTKQPFHVETSSVHDTNDGGMISSNLTLFKHSPMDIEFKQPAVPISREFSQLQTQKPACCGDITILPDIRVPNKRKKRIPSYLSSFELDTKDLDFESTKKLGKTCKFCRKFIKETVDKQRIHEVQCRINSKRKGDVFVASTNTMFMQTSNQCSR